jgi:hypothetical protein
MRAIVSVLHFATIQALKLRYLLAYVASYLGMMPIRNHLATLDHFDTVHNVSNAIHLS